VLSADQRALYYRVADLGPDGDPGPLAGSYVATRAAIDQPFAGGKRMTGRVRSYEAVTGVSADGHTLFMAAEFSTRVLVRSGLDQPFGGPSDALIPAQLPGWRAMPVGDCSRLVTTGTPGGCESEDIIYLDAVPR
jgi:hypothetical protein